MIRVNEAQFNGLGLLVGRLPDGRECVYYGGVQRVSRAALMAGINGEVEKAMRQTLNERADLAMLDDVTVAQSMELTGCYEVDSGDVLVMWRIACVRQPAKQDEALSAH